MNGDAADGWVVQRITSQLHTAQRLLDAEEDFATQGTWKAFYLYSTSADRGWWHGTSPMITVLRTCGHQALHETRIFLEHAIRHSDE